LRQKPEQKAYKYYYNNYHGKGFYKCFKYNFGNWAKDFTVGPVSFGLPTSNSTWVFLALYVAALVGLYIRKGWAVPVGRAGLVVAMVIFFPGWHYFWCNTMEKDK